VEGFNFDAGVLGCELSICLGVIFISCALSNDYFFDEYARYRDSPVPHNTRDEIRRGVTRLGMVREQIKATE
jgi:hypothetical protein